MTSPEPGEMEDVVERVRAALVAVKRPPPMPLPEQSSRAAEAGAARADDDNRRAWVSGIDAAILTLVDQTPALLAHLSRQEEEIKGLREESRELTKALTGLTCGGSEFFIRKGDRYVADTEACVDWVRRVREADRRQAITAIRERNNVSAALADALASAPESDGGEP